MPSQQQASTTPTDARDEWRTPRFVFDYMARRFFFEVDVAATEQNALCRYKFTRETNGLEQHWSHFSTAWCNPPYSKLDPWLEKAVAEAADGCTTVMLLPTPNGEERWGRWLYDTASEVIFINGRLTFLDSGGKPRAGNNRGSIIAIYRGHDIGNTRYRQIDREDMRAIAQQEESAS